MNLSEVQDEIRLKKAKQVIAVCWDSILDVRLDVCAKQFETLKEDLEILRYSEWMIDIELIERCIALWHEKSNAEIDFTSLEAYCSYMNSKQYSMFHIIKGWINQDESCFEYAIRIEPCAFYFYAYGMYLIGCGEYVKGIVQFQRSYDEAMKDSKLYSSMHAKYAMGIAYANLDEESLMYQSFRQSMEYAKALHEDKLCEMAYYNIGATYLSHGKIEEAYTYLKKGYHGNYLDDHKLAICLEAMNLKEEAKEYLHHGLLQKEQMDEVEILMLEVVQYRIDHEQYLEDAEYHEQIKRLFQLLKTKKPKGFSAFHLKYVLEVLEQERKYKEAYLLLKEFSNNY